MNSKEIDKRIRDIDAQLAELEKEEAKLKEAAKENEVVERVKLDQKEEAMETLKEVVAEFLEIEDLKAFRDKDTQLYKNMILTIVSWFDYLKAEKNESAEYEEAKNLIMSLGEKHKKLYDWCKYLIEKPLPEPLISLFGVEINVDKTNEFLIKDGVKLVVDVEQAKNLINTKVVLGSKEYNELKFEYKVIVGDKEYTGLYRVVDYILKQERPEGCPYYVSLMEWKKNADNENVLIFDIFEI